MCVETQISPSFSAEWTVNHSPLVGSLFSPYLLVLCCKFSSCLAHSNRIVHASDSVRLFLFSSDCLRQNCVFSTHNQAQVASNFLSAVKHNEGAPWASPLFPGSRLSYITSSDGCGAILVFILKFVS